MKKIIFIFALLFSLTSYSQQYISDIYYTGKRNNFTNTSDFSERKKVESIILIKDSAVIIDGFKRLKLTSDSMQISSPNYKGVEWFFIDNFGEVGIMSIVKYTLGGKTITFHFDNRLFAYNIKQDEVNQYAK